jgi:DNA repair exonuclease SbcCD ATPase subunit
VDDKQRKEQAIDTLIQQAFEQYGLIGLVVVVLIVGPAYTYLRTRNLRLDAEVKAQEVLNRILVDERDHAEALENHLGATLERLDAAKDEVFHLRMELAQTQHKLTEMPELSGQIQTITQRMNTLEGQMEQIRLQMQQVSQTRRSPELEAALASLS